MLQSLDTLIAFVVIMTIASLFVTIFVQMVSSALSMRGKNLANALALTFQTVAPGITDQAHALAARILSDPMFSDSVKTTKDRGDVKAGKPEKPWDILSFGDYALHLASAIRPDEVYAALKRLSERGGHDTIVARARVAKARAAVALLSAKDAADPANLTNVEFAKADADLKECMANDAKPDSLCSAATLLLAGLGVPAEQADATAQRVAALHDLADNLPGELPREIKTALDNQAIAASKKLVDFIDVERGKFDSWFNSAQNRAQQWFQMHTRIATIVISFLVAFLMQLDAVEIFQFVSTNSAARAALVASAPNLVQQGEVVLTRQPFIQRLNAAWPNKSEQLTSDEIKDVTNTTELQNKLRAKVAQKDTFDADFAKLIDTVSAQETAEQKEHLSTLTKTIDNTGFQFIPTGFWRWHTTAFFSSQTEFQAAKKAHKSKDEMTALQQKIENDMCNQFCSYWQHSFGMFLFAALLTLGAPTWFNILKNLTNLRPALAKVIADEQPPAAPTGS